MNLTPTYPLPTCTTQLLKLDNRECFSVFSKLTKHPFSTQRDFSRREELQQSDVERWLGFITFLCEVFGTMRSSGEPFRVLVCPIYTCLREVCIRFLLGHWPKLSTPFTLFE